jgi:sensor histidine kinase regulating citrate/malate metabolism
MTAATSQPTADKTRAQLILVAVFVCLFAVGMAGLLNFFKYRSNAERLVKERLVVTGAGIESSIRSSLSLGLQFADLSTLPEMMDRERGTDDLIRSIEVFDTDGRTLYSTDRLRQQRPANEAWVNAGREAEGAQWQVRAGRESAVGLPVRNGFGLVIGHVALRYAQQQVDEAVMVVARELALACLLVFILSATLASLALMAVMGLTRRDLNAVENLLSRSQDPAGPPPSSLKGPFSVPLRRFFDTVRSAHSQIAATRARLQRGGER